jgi:hypothetical protein
VEKNSAGKALGVRWKINMDLSPIPGLSYRPCQPTSDAVSGCIVYLALAHEAKKFAKSLGTIDGSTVHHSLLIENEVADMLSICKAFLSSPASGTRVMQDALGFGLQLWESQWLAGTPLTDALLANLPTLCMRVPQEVRQREAGRVLQRNMRDA